MQDLTIVGKWHKKTLNKIQKIIKYQHTNNIKRGITGFLFHGTPGTGKTTLAKKIGLYCGRHFGNSDLNNSHDYYQILDCAKLAHARYGETEAHIHQVFVEANNAIQKGINFQILIFDDADGLFITRDYGSKLEAWYIGQINVFFHELDELDTSNTCVILTTNRLDLMDQAVIDRLFPIEFPQIDEETLFKKVEEMCRELDLDSVDVELIKKKISSEKGKKSFRLVEKFVFEYYMVEKIGVDL